MTITHKITSKKNPKNVLYGNLLEKSYNISWNGFDFQIEGANGTNGFWNEDWEVEEILTLPEHPFAVIQFEDENYGTTRTLWRTGRDEWTETDGDYYSDEDLLDRVKESAKGGKFGVLFAGVPADEPAKVAAEDAGL